jgi:hypothetical protein
VKCIRRNPFNIHGVIRLTASALPGCGRSRSIRSAQGQQAAGRERAPAIRDHHERIGGRDVGPPRRQREQLTVLVVQVNPVLAPVLPVCDELEVPPGQRMEPVRHPDTSVPIIWIRCS